MANTQYEVNPGSIEACDQGCVCPVLDNNMGRGMLRCNHTLGLECDVDCSSLFWVSGECPLHGFKHEIGDLDEIEQQI